MTNYSEDSKAALIARLLLPSNASIPELAKETGVPQNTLYTWRSKNRGQATALNPASDSTGLSSSEKFTAVLEMAPLTEIELGEYCRAKGLFPEQLRSELNRKEKALAETAALLVLRKKAQAL